VSDLTNLPIAAMRDGLNRKDFSAKELAEAHIRAVEGARTLNAFTVETPERALAAADAADKDFAAGTAKPLSGIPLGIKDLFCTEGVETSASSNILKGFVPQYESTISARLFADGAGMLGKLNLDEFAMGSSTETSACGDTINPWRAADGRNLVPGGSSGGSSTAVAARLVAGATGTDTGGSIRQPAAFTGITGFKPTYGRCSRWGTVAFASSLDQAGPMARDVRDCAILLQSMAGFDAKDSTSLELPVPDFEAALTGDLLGKRVGIPREYAIDNIPADITALWEAGRAMLRDAGAEIVDISLPHTKYALPTYYIIAPAEASSNLARYDGVRYGQRETPDGGNLIDMYEATRSAGFGDEVKRRIMIGTYVLSAGYYDAYYLQAQKVRTLIKRDFEQAFRECDVILTPTAPSAAFPLAEKMDDPVSMYLNDVFCVPASLAGLPAMSVPVGLNADGLPLGLQLIGDALDEEGLFNAGYALERAAGFSAQPEKWW
jgi:aspartyl-tRNA(Asn)/glutamyl-tRNA(Gln) amidotransferase subunit A|tara:strand:- start:93380 stop:94855 length:1476 start_codon:yes stop_codon:yes gene_type:complete